MVNTSININKTNNDLSPELTERKKKQTKNHQQLETDQNRLFKQ
jgi:hypothetical protein